MPQPPLLVEPSLPEPIGRRDLARGTSTAAERPCWRPWPRGPEAVRSQATREIPCPRARVLSRRRQIANPRRRRPTIHTTWHRSTTPSSLHGATPACVGLLTGCTAIVDRRVEHTGRPRPRRLPMCREYAGWDGSARRLHHRDDVRPHQREPPRTTASSRSTDVYGSVYCRHGCYQDAPGL